MALHSVEFEPKAVPWVRLGEWPQCHQRQSKCGNLILIIFEGMLIESIRNRHTTAWCAVAPSSWGGGTGGGFWWMLGGCHWVEVGPWPAEVDDTCRVCVIGHGARLSGLVRRAAWCVARAGGGKRSAKIAAQVLRAHLVEGPGGILLKYGFTCMFR